MKIISVIFLAMSIICSFLVLSESSGYISYVQSFGTRGVILAVISLIFGVISGKFSHHF